MPTTFDEVLLDEMYSAIAEGGPEFSTAIVRSGSGGSVSSRAETREDYQSKYEISYGELENSRRELLRTFTILRKGMARGFRFLPPDDHTLTDELVGWLNPATGEVEYLAESNGSITDFYLIKHYSDQGNSYSRRIVKPSPFDDFHIDIYNGSDVLVERVTLDADSGLTAPYDVINETNSTTALVSGMGLTNFELHQWTGKLVVTGPIPNHWKIRVNCEYHVPVTFTDDWHKVSVDETTISALKVGLEELLPVELNIT